MLKKKSKKNVIAAAAFAAVLGLVLITRMVHSPQPEFIIGAGAVSAGIMDGSGMQRFDYGINKDVLGILGRKGVTHYEAGIKLSLMGRENFKSVLKNFILGRENGLIPCVALYLNDKDHAVTDQAHSRPLKLYSSVEKAFETGELTEKLVKDFKSAGVKIKLYSINCGCGWGNGEKNVLKIIKAAADSVRENDPAAKIMLNFSGWCDTAGYIECLESAEKYGISADYAGLSFYPHDSYEDGTSTPSIKNLIQCAEVISGQSGFPVIVKGAFDHNFSGGAQSSVSLYPVSETGQRDWLIDLLAACYESPAIKGFFYRSSGHLPGQGNPSALFSSKGEVLAAADAFKAFREPVMNAFEYAEKTVSSSTGACAESNAFMEQARFLLRDGSVEEAKFKARLAEYKASE